MAAATVTTSLPQFNGLKSKVSYANVQSLAAVQPMRRKGQGALGARCDFIGSPTNLIMVTTTTLMLFAGRFGLAPSANRKATAGLKLETRDSGLHSNIQVYRSFAHFYSQMVIVTSKKPGFSKLVMNKDQVPTLSLYTENDGDDDDDDDDGGDVAPAA